MRHLLLVIFLCAIPFAPSHANQQFATIIESIEIDGISILTSLEDTRANLLKKGYEELRAGRGIVRFKKGICHIDVSTNARVNMLRYRCDGSKPDADATIIGAFEKLCAAENNGKDGRTGCQPSNSRTNINRIETFETVVDGTQYSTRIWDMQNTSGPRIRHIDIFARISQ